MDAHDASLKLYLEVILNDAPTGLIAAFVERPDGGLAIAPAELAELGIAPSRATLAKDGNIDLGAIGGLTYLYDQNAQVVRIVAPPELLLTRVLEGGAEQRAPAPHAPQSGTGAVLNYSLYGGLDAECDLAFSAALEGRFYAPIGNLTQSAIATTSESAGFLRLDTTFSHSDAERLLTWRAGDLISGGLSWTRPVRLGGFQIARRFGLRPDLVTMPIPAFSGSAAVPSTVDVYANGALLYSTNIPAGPFALTNLPIVSGAGTARIVLTDALGRKTETNVPFFAGASLLRKGLLDFSAEAGFPRRSYGVLSNDYSRDVAASASARYGLTDTLTVEGHVEATSDLINGGVGFRMPLGTRGLGAFAVAASGGTHSGVLANAEVELRFGRIALRGRSMRAFGDYADIASITADPMSAAAGAPRAIDQFGLTVPLARYSAATVSFARIETSSGEKSQVAGLSFSQRLPGDANLYVHGFQAFDGSRNQGLYIGLSRPLTGGAYVATSANRDNNGAGGGIDIVKSERAVVGSYGWRLRAVGGGDTDLLAAASYRAPAARIAANVQSNDGVLSGGAEASGAVVFAEGDLFYANRIDDAFAIVNAGAPNVTVFADNRPAGRTGRNGKVLVTGLRSYETNKISIDPTDLPLDVDANNTKLAVVPADRAGVPVDFNVTSNVNSARVVFRDKAGRVLQPGLAGRLETGEEFVIGYDGEAYIQGLAASNKAVVALEEGGNCTAVFAFTPKAGDQALIEAGACL